MARQMVYAMAPNLVCHSGADLGIWERGAQLPHSFSANCVAYGPIYFKPTDQTVPIPGAGKLGVPRFPVVNYFWRLGFRESLRKIMYKSDRLIGIAC